MAREYPKDKRDTWHPGTKGWDAKHAKDQRTGYTKAVQFANGGAVPNVTQSPLTVENQGTREYPKGERKVSTKSDLHQFFARPNVAVPHYEDGGSVRDGDTPGGYAGGGYGGASSSEGYQGAGNIRDGDTPGGYAGGGYGGAPVDHDYNAGNVRDGDVPGGYAGGGYGGSSTGGWEGGNPADREDGTISSSGYYSSGDQPSWERSSPVPQSRDGFAASGRYDNPEPDWKNDFNEAHLPTASDKVRRDEHGMPVDPVEMRNAIYNDAIQHGLNPRTSFDALYAESRFQPTAQHGSFKGIAQIGPDFQSDFGVQNPNDWRQGVEGMAAGMASNRAALKKATGQDPSDADLYTAHQQGLTAAARLLGADPNEKAVVARKNADAIKANMPPGTDRNDFDKITVQEFRDKWASALAKNVK